MTAETSATIAELPAAAPVAPNRAAGQQQSPLLANRVRQLDVANNSWSAVVPAGTPVDALTGEKLWSNVADKFHEGDQIHVRTDDGAYYSRLFVRAASRTWVKLAVLELHMFSGGAEHPARTREHAVKYLGAHLKWCAIRLADGSVISPAPGFESEKAARQWLDGHEMALQS
jgi:hypothetical protein